MSRPAQMLTDDEIAQRTAQIEREGSCIYRLHHEGRRRGRDVFTNRFMAQFTFHNDATVEEREATIGLFIAAPAMAEAIQEALHTIPPGPVLDALKASLPKQI